MKKVLILSSEDVVSSIWDISTQKQEEAAWHKAFKELNTIGVFDEIRDLQEDIKETEHQIQHSKLTIDYVNKKVAKKFKPLLISLLQYEQDRLTYRNIWEAFTKNEVKRFISLYKKAKEENGKAAKKLIKMWFSEGYDRLIWNNYYLTIKKVK